MSVLLLREDELRSLVPVDDAVVDRVQQAFVWKADGRVVSPPIMHIEVPSPRGDVDIKSAYVSGQRQFAVKIGAGFFDNPAHGLPSSSAMVVLISAITGRCEGVFLDNGYLTDVRTGAAGAVAVRHLARADARSLAIVGAGAQARFQLRAMRHVRSFERIAVHGRDPTRCEAFRDEMERELGVRIEIASLDDACRGADVIVTTTPATRPVLTAAQLESGQLVVAVGSDTPAKQELASEVLGRADRIVCDSIEQCLRLGELRHAVEAGVLLRSDPCELGEVVSGRHPGRSGDDEIIVCDLTGMGVQDTAIALYAAGRAERARVGMRL